MKNTYLLSQHDFALAGHNFRVLNTLTGEEVIYDLSGDSYLVKIEGEILEISSTSGNPPIYQHDFALNAISALVDKEEIKFVVIGTINIDDEQGGVISKNAGYLFDINDEYIELFTSGQDVLSVKNNDPVLNIRIYEDE